MKVISSFKTLAAVAVMGMTFALSGCGSDKKSVWEELAASAPDSPSDAVIYFRKEAGAFSDVELNELARAVVETRDLTFIQKVSNELIYATRDKKDNKLGVYVAEQAYLLKKDALMANRAALEYKLGRFVNKDLVKATEILSSPVLKRMPLANFYLAEILLDESNPNRDPAEGKELMQKTASAGLKIAQERVKQLN